MKVIYISVSIKPTPIIKGEAAKKLLKDLSNPADNSEFYKKCKEEAKIFTVINKEQYGSVV